MHHESEFNRDTIIRLQIAGDDLRFSVLEKSGADEVRNVSVGSISPIRAILRHEPVTAAELEAVIAEVEDLIMPVIRTLPTGGVLEVQGRELCEAAGALPSLREAVATIQFSDRNGTKKARAICHRPIFIIQLYL